jgi:hypothetical protein
MLRRLGFLVLAVGALARPAAAQFTRVSVATDGSQGNGASTHAVLSGNGRFVAFESAASNLVAGDTNGAKDVFVRDLVAHVTTRVSVASDGTERSADSVVGDISNDGNLIVFASRGAFVAEDTNQCDDAGTMVNCTDVYVHDRATAQTTRVSVASNGTQATLGAGSPSITADGRFVGFISPSSNLVTGDTNGLADGFLHDRVLHTTVRVSLGAEGQQAAAAVSRMALSKDGRTVAFVGDEVMFGGEPFEGDCFPATVSDRAFVKTLATGAVIMLPPLPAQPNLVPPTCTNVTGVHLTADGRLSAVETSFRLSHGTSLSTGLYDVATGAAYGGGVDSLSVMSADGRYITSLSTRDYSGVPPSEGPPKPMLIWDRATDFPEYIPAATATPTADLYPQSFDTSGRYLAFYSAESTLVASDTNGVEDVFLLDRDRDSDGMPSFWETTFGLDPDNAADAGADLDGDGVTNLQEFQANTLPTGVQKRYFAEGVANTFFATTLTVFNPGDTRTHVSVQLQGSTGPSTSRVASIDAKFSYSFYLNDNLPDTVFSIVVESEQPVVADRLVTWDTTFYGSHLETAIESPGTSWYFAEGATGGPYSLYYLMQNPGPTDATATVTYLRPTPLPPITKSYTVAAHSRKTIDVRGEDPGLSAAEVSAQISSDQPIVAERALYYSTPTQFQAAGHDGAGIPAPSTHWFMAEGATGFFDEYVLIANPDAGQDANLTITYLLENGVSFSEPIVVAKQSRFTLDLKSRDARLQATPVSVIVESTNSVPVVAERAMWWPHGDWYEASLSAGTTATGTRWAVAATGLGGSAHASTYVLIANTDSTDAVAKVTLFHAGPLTEEKSFPIKAQSRFSVDVGAEFPNARTFAPLGIIVESNGPQIVVERALYFSPNPSRPFEAGATSVATRLPAVP